MVEEGIHLGPQPSAAACIFTAHGTFLFFLELFFLHDFLFLFDYEYFFFLNDFFFLLLAFLFFLLGLVFSVVFLRRRLGSRTPSELQALEHLQRLRDNFILPAKMWRLVVVKRWW